MRCLCTTDTLVQVNQVNPVTGVKENIINLRARANEIYDEGYDLTLHAPECFINLDDPNRRGSKIVAPVPGAVPPVAAVPPVGAETKETNAVLRQRMQDQGIPNGTRMNKHQLRAALAAKEQADITRMTREDPHEEADQETDQE